MGVVMVAAAGASHPAAADPPCRPGEAVGRLRSLGGCWLLAGCCCCCCCCCCSACSACCSAQPSCARALGRVATHGGDDSCRAGMGGGAAKQQTPRHGAPSTAQTLDARRSTLDARRSTLDARVARSTRHRAWETGRGTGQKRSLLGTQPPYVPARAYRHMHISRSAYSRPVHIHVRICVYIFMRTRTHTHARTHAGMHARTHTCMPAPTHSSSHGHAPDRGCLVPFLQVLKGFSFPH